jgi:hypothetical protein
MENRVYTWYVVSLCCRVEGMEMGDSRDREKMLEPKCVTITPNTNNNRLAERPRIVLVVVRIGLSD